MILPQPKRGNALRDQGVRAGRDLSHALQFFDVIWLRDQVASHALKPLGQVSILALIRQTGADASLSPQVNCQNHKKTPLRAAVNLEAQPRAPTLSEI